MRFETVVNDTASSSRSNAQPLVSLIIGDSPRMVELKRLVKIVGPSLAPVMLSGETGVGKDIVAQDIHGQSLRSGPFVAINCAAIPAELLESELFGYEKGAFTGADRARMGRFEMSNGGTLFLDEIGDMPLALQSKLLRTLENHCIQRIGGNREIKLDLRLICATHQNVERMVEDGRFRADLYYRLATFPIKVPPLSERREDIPALLEAMMVSYLERQPGALAPRFSPAAVEALKGHEWPGNVRELRNVLERAFVLFAGQEISGRNVVENLLRLRLPEANAQAENDALWEAAATFGGEVAELPETITQVALPSPEDFRLWFRHNDEIDLRGFIRDVEVVLIEAALAAKDGLVSHAADALKLRRTTLIEKMKKLMIERPNLG
ncbi:MAG: sigma-54 dependent transcriptional regulator [Proteobacteria bacterium]|nr:sigma-54 dependent transcriptional regulator [Pseudomonadota bacterium]